HAGFEQSVHHCIVSSSCASLGRRSHYPQITADRKSRDRSTPHVNNVPFSMSGQGQQSAIKISLAMNRHARRTKFVMVEELENHLTHTSLVTLLGRIESLAGEQQQLFISTHSSFVLNRLGLDSLILMGHDSAAKLSELDAETVSYFKR